jgi:hypothetical protein
MSDGAKFIGMTTMSVGLSAMVAFTPPERMVSGQFKILAGGGTLGIANTSSGAGSANSYLVGASEIVELNGPAKFFLGATGATMTVGVMIRYSSGLSGTIFT